MSRVLVAGGTGYLGKAVVPALLASGREVALLVRPGSEHKVPPGALAIGGDPLLATAYPLHPDDTLLLLVGTPHPAPWKAPEFEAVDFAAGRAAATALARQPVRHVVYLSVAHPAPAMHAYWGVRQRVEALLRDCAVPATFLRPWYVLGPGHRWAHLLRPFYALAELFPPTREGARRLGLVTLPQMTAALLAAVVEPPPSGVRVVEVPAIRAAGRARAAS
jgi:uncharacterized protein YbjT (DUF2867 family)